MFALRAQCARIVAVNARRSSVLQVLAASRLLKNGNTPHLLSPAHQPSVLVSSKSIPQPKWFTGLPKRAEAVAGMSSSVGDAFLVLGKAKELMEDKTILGLPPLPLHYIQPRPEVKELEKMFESFQKQDVANTVYLTGIPAQGKTELARQFGNEFHRKKRGYVNKKVFVGTLNAKSPSELLQSYCQLAQTLGCENALVLEASKGDPNILAILSNAIGKELKKRPGWLLIVDNLSLDVQNNWNSIWPQPGDKRWGKGCVLVTTQDRNLVAGSSPFVKELYLSEGLSESDAVELLKEMSGCRDEGAEVVVNSPSVNRVPLSVASVGVYMKIKRSRNPSFSFKDYLKLIERVPRVQEESEKLLQKDQQGVYPYTMEVATTMAAEQMAKDDPNLHKVFTLLAICDQSPVPMSVVVQVLEVQPGINTVLESVRKCAFLSSHTQGDIETVSVHQLRREVFKDLFLRDTSTGTQQQRNNLLRHIVDCLSQEYAKARVSETVSSYRMRILLPHMEGLLQVSTTVSGFQLDANHEMTLCSLLGEGYTLVGRYREAKDMLERAKGVCEREGGKETELATTIALELGKTYRRLAMYKESESILKEVLAIREKQHGENSVEVADALNNLGNTYRMMGQLKESRECYEHALQIYQQAYGHKHSTVAGVLNNLGNIWLDLGDPAKSKELYEEALAIDEEIYGPAHPEVALTCNNLGNAYRVLRVYHKSIEMYERSLEIDKDIYGEDHDEVATTLTNLGGVYYRLGDVHKGKEYAEEALKKKEAIYGPRHPDVAIALHNLGLDHLALEELDNAQQCLQRSIDIRKEMVGPKHRDTIKTQRLLGGATRLAGSLEDARQILETALETQESISSDLGSDRGLLVLICWELGKVYRELGYLTQSEHTLRRALDMGKQLNPNHPEVQFIQADLARALWDAGEVKTGIGLMQEALTLSQSKTYTNADHLAEYSSMLATMGLMLRDNGELSQARKYLEDSLRNQEKLKLPHNLLKAETMGILGTVLHRLGTPRSEFNPITFLRLKYYRDQARQHLYSALEIMKRVRYNHPITATILAAIGRMHMDIREFPSARDCLEEALRIQSNCCGSTDIHPDIALYHTMLAEITSGESAMNHRQKADKIYRALLKSEGAGMELPVLQQWRKGLLDKGTNDDDSVEQN